MSKNLAAFVFAKSLITVCGVEDSDKNKCCVKQHSQHRCQVGNMLKVRVLLFALVITSCIQWTRTDCGHLEIVCGDKCLNSITDLCFCGLETVSSFTKEICCNYDYCFKDEEMNFVYCNGQKQNASEPCKGQCIQPTGGKYSK